jgi:hypothetical protein
MISQCIRQQKRFTNINTIVMEQVKLFVSKGLFSRKNNGKEEIDFLPCHFDFPVN